MQNYCLFFKERANTIIAESEKNKIILTNPEASKSWIIPQKHPVQLSNRQSICAHLLMKGMTYKEIGKELNLSPRTVETHIIYIKNKLQCRTKIELIIKLTHILRKDALL